MASTVEIAAAEIAEWLSTAPGQRHNPDNNYGLQCVDTADQYAQDIFGVPWHVSLGAVAGAKDLLASANRDYFQVVRNDPNDPDLLPPVGAVVIWGGSAANPWGHVAVVVSRTKQGVRVVQQDGFAEPRVRVLHPDGVTSGFYSDKPVHYADLGWNNPGTGMVSGWLIPRPEKVKDTGAIKRGFGVKPEQPKYDPVATVTPTGVLHGIDTSSWQKGIDLAAVPADFVIVKVTGGTKYLNPEAKAQVAAARAAGKLIGLYHYAHEANYGPASAKAEAEFFLRHALPLADENTNLILDWEAKTVIGPSASGVAGNVWAKQWLDHVRAQTGARPWLYGYLSALAAHSWPTVATTYPLWIAWYGTSSTFHGYAKDFTLPFKPPAGFTLIAWQYSQFGRLGGYGGDLDLNVFFGTAQTWKATATGRLPSPVKPGTVPPKAPAPASNTNLVPPKVHVVAAGESLSGIAAHYGTTVAELRRLNTYITNPDYLAVGDRLRLPDGSVPPAPRVTQVIVEPGDNLTAIAAQFSTTVASIVAKNPTLNPNLIHPGQVLNI